MWKWVGGFVLLLVVGFCGMLYYGYRQMSKLGSGDGRTTTMIAASPARVFASLANGDSMPEWMTLADHRPSRYGLLKVGDTVYVTPRDSMMGSAGPRMHWVVAEVTAGKTFALWLYADSVAVAAVTRQYSLEQRGDSTALTTVVNAPMRDSSAAAANGSTVMSMTARLMLASIRMQSQFEVEQLRARIEGRPLRGAPPRL